MNYRDLAEQINERLRLSHELSIKKSTPQERKVDDEEFLRLWYELNELGEMTTEQYIEFKKLCPFLEAFCMIASGTEWDSLKNEVLDDRQDI